MANWLYYLLVILLIAEDEVASIDHQYMIGGSLQMTHPSISSIQASNLKQAKIEYFIA